MMAQISTEEALSLAAKIEAITSNPESIHGLQNDSLRQRLREAGRKLSHAMEIPVDTARRLQSTVSTRLASTYHWEFTLFSIQSVCYLALIWLTFVKPLDLPAAFIGVEKGIFSALASQSGTSSISELSEKTRIDPVLLSKCDSLEQPWFFFQED